MPHRVILTALIILALMPGVAVSQSNTTIILDLANGECPPNPAPVSDERVAELLQNLESEELNFGQVHRLARMYLNFRCGLSPLAQVAESAFLTEAATRRLDPIAVMRQEVDLVTPALFPEEWDALLLESGHPPEQVALKKLDKVEPIVMGCVAVISYLGSSGACALDVIDAHFDCVTDAVCSGNETADDNCCDEKRSSDELNCWISGGLNGPDGDYANCCS